MRENSVSSVPRQPHSRKRLGRSARLELLSGTQQPGDISCPKPSYISYANKEEFMKKTTPPSSIKDKGQHDGAYLTATQQYLESTAWITHHDHLKTSQHLKSPTCVEV